VRPFCSFASGSFYSLSSLFIVDFNLCLNVSMCSYGREFARRQPLRSTSLRRIGSTCSPVLFFRLVSPYSDQYYEWFNCRLFFLPFVEGMQSCFCLSFCGLEIQIFFHMGLWWELYLNATKSSHSCWCGLVTSEDCLFYVLGTCLLYYSLAV